MWKGVPYRKFDRITRYSDLPVDFLRQGSFCMALFLRHQLAPATCRVGDSCVVNLPIFTPQHKCDNGKLRMWRVSSAKDPFFACVLKGSHRYATLCQGSPYFSDSFMWGGLGRGSPLGQESGAIYKGTAGSTLCRSPRNMSHTHQTPVHAEVN